jgi:CheY-like chemotaxis protein
MDGVFGRSNAGLETRHAADGQSALSLARDWPPDLVVLDLMLPGIDGLEVCRRLRAAHGSQRALPVIMLTALGEEADRVAGLESGADDYVTKPFSPRELTLRVQAVLRRVAAVAETAPPEPFRAGRFEVDVAARRIRRDGVTVCVRRLREKTEDAVLAVVAGTLGTANAMFLSQHDLRRSKLPLPGGATRGRRPGQAGRARPASRSAPVPVRALSHSADAPSDAAGFPDISTTPAYPPAWPASRAR